MIYIDLTTAATVVFNCTRIPGTIVTLYSYYPIFIDAIIRDMQWHGTNATIHWPSDDYSDIM